MYDYVIKHATQKRMHTNITWNEAVAVYRRRITLHAQSYGTLMLGLSNSCCLWFCLRSPVLLCFVADVAVTLASKSDSALTKHAPRIQLAHALRIILLLFLFIRSRSSNSSTYNLFMHIRNVYLCFSGRLATKTIIKALYPLNWHFESATWISIMDWN